MDIVNSIIESSNIIKAPVQETSTTEAQSKTEVQMTPAADLLGLTAFYLPSASELVDPQTLADIHARMNEIIDYAKEVLGKKATDESIRDYIGQIITDNEIQNEGPLIKLEKVFMQIDLKKRLAEIKKLKELIKVGKDESKVRRSL